MKQKEIILKVYYYEADDGSEIIDEEAMREDFENILKELKESKLTRV